MRNISEIYKDMLDKQEAYNKVKEEMIEALMKDIGHVVLIDINKAKSEWIENQIHIIQK
jgi:hypothetical protein